jgi:succinate dehydrogenase hydrophobic membrane anchor protein
MLGASSLKEQGMSTSRPLLIIDDDAHLRETLAEQLSVDGDLLPAVAGTLAEAEALLGDGETRFDAILLDITMPDGDGCDFCGKLRKQGLRMPIIMLTGSDGEVDIVRGLDAGANDYIAKGCARAFRAVLFPPSSSPVDSPRELAKVVAEELRKSCGLFAFVSVSENGNVLLTTWFVLSLFMIPSFEHGALAQWLAQPLVAVPMILMIANIFSHVKLGLQVLIEDYVHDEGLKFASMTLLNFYVIASAVFGIFVVAKLAFTGVPA